MREGEKDPGLYDFRPYRGRPKLEWPDGKTVDVTQNSVQDGIGKTRTAVHPKL